MRMEENYIIIEPNTKPRTDWVKSFKEMRKMEMMNLLIQDIFRRRIKMGMKF